MLRLFLGLASILLLALILSDAVGKLTHSRPLRDTVGVVVVRPVRPLATTAGLAAAPPASSASAVAGNNPSVVDALARLAIRQRLRGEGADTYLDSMVQTTDSVVRRWPSALRTPLRVAIVASPLPGFDARMADFVRDALDVWESLRLGIRFSVEDDTTTADITVRWIAQFQRDRAGQTDLSWDRTGRIHHADISLALRDQAGRLLPEAALRGIAVHEVGHALGLPHSAEQGDIMFPSAYVTEPSARDRRTIILLYDLPPGPIIDPGSAPPRP